MNKTHFSSDSTCFSLSLKRYVGFAAISQSNFGRQRSLKESVNFCWTISKAFFCSSLCFSVNAFLKNFISILSAISASSLCLSDFILFSFDASRRILIFIPLLFIIMCDDISKCVINLTTSSLRRIFL